MADDYGVIDLSDVVKAPRGASAEFEPELLDAMVATAKAGRVLTAPVHAAPRSAFPSTEEGKAAWANAKQTKSAHLRKHFDRLLADGKFPSEVKAMGIDWHPDTGVPQIRFKRT